MGRFTKHQVVFLYERDEVRYYYHRRSNKIEKAYKCPKCNKYKHHFQKIEDECIACKRTKQYAEKYESSRITPDAFILEEYNILLKQYENNVDIGTRKGLGSRLNALKRLYKL